jgi:DNA polymerase III alpha subunit
LALNGEPPQGRLSRLCFTELPHRYREQVPPQAILQLDHELRVIGRWGLADYFLVVREIVDFARAQRIPETVRGSAAGSLVTYLICGGVDPLAQGRGLKQLRAADTFSPELHVVEAVILSATQAHI